MNTIRGKGTEILGAVSLRVSGIDGDGKFVEAPNMIYVTDSTTRFYLSNASAWWHRARLSLCVCISNTGDLRRYCKLWMLWIPQTNQTTPLSKQITFCSCSRKHWQIKPWIAKRYTSSTFNKCPYWQLPMINSKPLKLHMDTDAKPWAVFTEATVPIH